jgi:hypothetical protein
MNIKITAGIDKIIRAIGDMYQKIVLTNIKKRIIEEICRGKRYSKEKLGLIRDTLEIDRYRKEGSSNKSDEPKP